MDRDEYIYSTHKVFLPPNKWMGPCASSPRAYLNPEEMSDPRQRVHITFLHRTFHFYNLPLPFTFAFVVAPYIIYGRAKPCIAPKGPLPWARTTLVRSNNLFASYEKYIYDAEKLFMTFMMKLVDDVKNVCLFRKCLRV